MMIVVPQQRAIRLYIFLSQKLASSLSPAAVVYLLLV
jgi:hypothetical protein